MTFSPTEVSGNEKLGRAIGRIPSGVFIVTAELDGQKVGMMASWVQQAGFSPPAVSIAIHPDRELHTLIRKTGRMTINIVSRENTLIMRTFSKYRPDQFDQVDHYSTYCGLVLRDAVAYLDGVVLTSTTVTDHVLYVVETVDGNVLNGSLEPMTHLRRTGFDY